MKMILILLLPVFLVIGCQTVKYGGYDPHVIEQAETIMEMENVIGEQAEMLGELKEGNDELGKLLEGISGDVSDLNAWAAQWKPFTENIYGIYLKNMEIFGNE